jgi:hypothetical protein
MNGPKGQQGDVAVGAQSPKIHPNSAKRLYARKFQPSGIQLPGVELLFARPREPGIPFG